MKINWIKYSAIFLFLVSFLIIHIYLKNLTKAPEGKLNLNLGSTAPPFSGMTLSKDEVKLQDIAKKNKLVVINFFESWCGPCMQEMPDLQKTYSNFKNSGLEILAVFQSSSEESVKKMISKNSIEFLVIRDRDDYIFKAYGIDGVPATVVVDSNMKIVRSNSGVDIGLDPFLSDYFMKKGKK